MASRFAARFPFLRVWVLVPSPVGPRKASGAAARPTIGRDGFGRLSKDSAVGVYTSRGGSNTFNLSIAQGDLNDRGQMVMLLYFGGDDYALCLTELALPLLDITEVPGDQVGVSWESRVGFEYQPQVSADLATWTDVGPPLAGDGTELEFQQPADDSVRYFRILQMDL